MSKTPRAWHFAKSSVLSTAPIHTLRDAVCTSNGAVPALLLAIYHLTPLAVLTVTILQAVISVSVDMLPLPGGMGISETLYMVMFVPVFGPLLLPSMLLSRGISYYGQMLISALMTCVAHLTIGRKNEEIQRM